MQRSLFMFKNRKTDSEESAHHGIEWGCRSITKIQLILRHPLILEF